MGPCAEPGDTDDNGNGGVSKIAMNLNAGAVACSPPRQRDGQAAARGALACIVIFVVATLAGAMFASN